MISAQDEFKRFCDVDSFVVVDGSLKTDPVLTIAIPTFQRGALLVEAVRSALAQQTRHPFEVLVVDNGDGTDGVEQAIRSLDDPRVRLFRNRRNIGMFGNWNRCLELANGRWVSILNDDDLLEPSFVEQMLAQLERHEEIKMLCCRVSFLEQRGSGPSRVANRLKFWFKRKLHQRRAPRTRALSLFNVFLDPPGSSLGVVFDRSTALSIGGFQTDTFPIADYVFAVSFAERVGIHRYEAVLAKYRLHANETANPDTARKFIAKGLDLRRAIAPLIDAPSQLLRLYGDLYALNTARLYRSRWGVRLSALQIRREHDVTHLPTVPSFWIIRVILRCLEIAKRERSHWPRVARRDG